MIVMRKKDQRVYGCSEFKLQLVCSRYRNLKD